MRIIKSTILGLAIIASIIHANAIEHLQISVQCTNVVLRWPCLDDGSEQFIVQYRSTLSPTDSWQTLETSLPATYGTNEMYYTNWGVVLTPANCDGGGSFSMMMMMMGGSEMSLSASQPSEPMATPNSGGAAAPVKLYPDGFDFTNFTITVPGTSGSLSGAEFMEAESGDPLDPNGGGEPSGDGGTNTPPDVGFYRVVRVGPHMMGITNGMLLTGTVTIPLEIGNYAGDLTSVSLTENGVPLTSDSIHPAPFELPLPLITLNTAMMTNGVHQFTASARWDDTNGGVWEADSQPISVTVSNEITFENWVPQFGELGDSLVIRATSAHTNTDWYIDVYDSSNIYIGTFGGHTDDGDIYVVWDLVGPDSVLHTNDAFFNFYIETEYVDPPMPPTFKQKDPWKTSGGWVFAVQHAFDNLLDHETLYEELNGMLGGAGSAYTIRPTPSSGNPFAISFHDANEVSGWTTFKQALFNNGSRNLWYFGHGSPTGLGYNQGNTNVSVSATEIGNLLHTIPAGQTNRHPYRFVFLDGCSTAKGTLPEAFGIANKENVPGIDYLNSSSRRSAFCGWSDDKSVGYSVANTINYDHVSFITLIQTYMLLGQGLKTAVNGSASQPNIPLVTTGDFKVYGYWDLHIGTDNN